MTKKCEFENLKIHQNGLFPKPYFSRLKRKSFWCCSIKTCITKNLTLKKKQIFIFLRSPKDFGEDSMSYGVYGQSLIVQGTKQNHKHIKEKIDELLKVKYLKLYLL